MKNRLLLTAITVLLGSLMVACGGGGGGSSSSGTSSGGATTLNVTAATGDPIVDASIVVVDAAGVSETCAGTTDANGALTCTLSNAKTYPFLIQASKQSSITYAVLPSSSSTVNVTPVSDLIAKKVAGDLNASPVQLINMPSMMAGVSTSSAKNAANVVTSILNTVAPATSGALTDDPLVGTYKPTSSTDKLDQFIKNFPMNADSGNLNMSIPLLNGTVVNVSVPASTNDSAAAGTAAANILKANNVTPAGVSLDGDAILSLADSFFDLLGKCGGNAGLETQMVAMIDPGATYQSGFTVAGWVHDMCQKTNLAGIKRYGVTKSLGRLGNSAIYFMGLRQASTGTYAETIFGFKKVNGRWYMGADDMPISMSDSVRHALSFNFDTNPGSTNNTPHFAYQRYVDAWVGTTDAQNKVTGLATGATAPDKIQVFAMSLTDAQVKAKQGTGFPSSPNYTLYRVASPGSTCGNTNYTLNSNRTSCGSFVVDKASTYDTWDMVDSTGLFDNVLEKNEFNVFIYKLLDGSGNCMNCDNVSGSQIPRAASVLGRAWKFADIFGNNSDSESSLRAGTVVASSANLGTARNTFAAPSKTDLTAIVNSFYGTSLGASFTLPWVTPASYPIIDTNLWGNSYRCGVNNPTSVDYSVDTFDIKGNSYTFTYGKSPQQGNSTPEFGKTFNNAQYLSFALATNVQRSEFTFYVQGGRSNICTN